MVSYRALAICHTNYYKGFINQEKLEYVTFLRGIPFFKQLNEDKIRMLCNNLLGKFYYKDDCMIRF